MSTWPMSPSTAAGWSARSGRPATGWWSTATTPGGWPVFDQALWSFAPLAFIPHVPVRHPLASRTPVLLTASATEVPASHRQVLVNLGDGTPPAFADYQRVVELVGTDAASRQAARARFRFYREQGHAPFTHDVEERDGSR